MEGTSVLAQNKQKTPAEKSTNASSGEQSVLGGSNREHKPVTFYKKAWFWIIIAVVVLGIAALIVFLVINATMTEEAIKKYDENAKAVDTAASEFESKFSSIYIESGLPGYYSSNNERATELRNKCLEKFDIEAKVMEDIDNIDTYDGEIAVEKYGAGKTRELSEKFEKTADKLKNAKKNVTECKDILKDALYADVEVKFGEFKIIKKTYWDDSEVKATVTNKSDESHSFRIKVSAQDKKGKEIDNDIIYTTTLGPGESADYTIFDYVASSKIESMKDAKFVVTELSEN